MKRSLAVIFQFVCLAIVLITLSQSQTTISLATAKFNSANLRETSSSNFLYNLPIGAPCSNENMHVMPSSIQFPIPTTGTQRLLAILVDFPDKPGTYSGTQWKEFFFGSNGFSDFFEASSYNQLCYTGKVAGILDGRPVVDSQNVAYVRLPNSITYYTNGNAGTGNAFPRNARGVAFDALTALGNAGFDFSSFANPQTKELENVVVVFSGLGLREANYDGNLSFLPSSYSLYFSPPRRYTASDGYFVEEFTFCPEQRRFSNDIGMATIGVCVHEHGHSLGTIDLYDLSGNTVGVGRFDIMGSGIESGNIRLPFGFGPYSKQQVGWLRFLEQEQPDGIYEVNLMPAATSQEKQYIKLFPNGNPNSTEYYLLENRQPVGVDSEWNTYGLTPGLIIWRINGMIANGNASQNEYIYYNVVNTPFPFQNLNTPDRHGVIVVEADGRFDMIRTNNNFGEARDTWIPGQTWSVPEQELSVSVLRQNYDGSLDVKIVIGQENKSNVFLPLISSK